MKPRGVCSSTVTYHDLEFAEAARLLASDGFRAIDLTIIPGSCLHFDLENESPEQVTTLKAILAQRDLSVTSLTVVPGYFNSSRADQTSRLLKRAIDLASQLGVKIVSIPPGEPVDRHKWTRAVEHIRPYLERIETYAAKRGVELSIEAPHLGTLVETVGQAVRFFRMLSNIDIKCTFDTSHVFRGEQTDPIEALDALGVERVNHVHLRDVIGEDVTVTPGRGQFDFRTFFKALQARGYDGALGLELEPGNVSVGRRRKEMRFARRYLEVAWTGERLPAGLRLWTTAAGKSVGRLLLNPKQEAKRYPRFFRSLREMRVQAARLAPHTVYDGTWTRRRYRPEFGLRAAKRPGSVALVRTPEKLLRVGVLGAGYAGEMHAYGYRRLRGVQVVGVCDLNAARARTLAERLGCGAYSSLAEMIDAEKPGLVSVCTREWQHFEPVVWLLEHGVDVFCEKIMATRYDQGQQMVDLARQKGRVLAVNYNYRFKPGIQKLRELLRGGALGQLLLLNMQVHGFSYHHALDLVSFLAGGIQRVQASFTKDDSLRPFGGTDWSLYDPDILYVPSRNLAAVFEVEGGALATITSSCVLNTRQLILDIHALFEGGAVALTGVNALDVVGRLTWSCPALLAHTDMDHTRGVFARGYEYTFYRSIEAFVNSYVHGKVCETPGETGLYNMALEKAVGRAARTGCRVEVEE